MKASITRLPTKKLVAVIASTGGIFFNTGNIASVFINTDGECTTGCRPLEHLLKEDHLRVAVYEGDVVTLTF